MRSWRPEAQVGGRRLRTLRQVLRLGLLSALVVPALVGAGVFVQAAGPASSLHLSAHAATHAPQTVLLVATLDGPPAGTPRSGNAPVAGTEVDFSVRLGEFAGAPLLAIGSATTNAEGTAAVAYTMTWTGGQTFVATATDPSGDTIASATTSFTAAQAGHPFAGTVQAVRPDGAIGSVVADVLLGTVTLLWITLITIVVRVNVGLAARRG
ncbi:MAG: hypothetical protein ACYCYK_04525 [Candidatus Dormibacteria bacterium]